MEISADICRYLQISADICDICRYLHRNLVIIRSSRHDKSRVIFVIGLGLSLSTDPIGLNGTF